MLFNRAMNSLIMFMSCIGVLVNVSIVWLFTVVNKNTVPFD